MAQYPFQKLCCVRPVDDQPPFLLAASGSAIYSFDLKTGSLLFQWPQKTIAGDNAKDHSTQSEGEDRPAKRRKVGTDSNGTLSREATDDSIEIISERQKGERRQAKAETPSLPTVSHLITTSDATTVVALTAEDKCVNVFKVEPRGHLNLQSKRSMPKRICAVVFTPDEKTIVVGDKFGDVHSLPLYPTEGWTPQVAEQHESEGSYVPSATELTVHTKGNLAALKFQREMKTRQPRKLGPDFETKMLLGHVSLLTDVASVEVQDGLKRRQYLLTADRDEHIRVSRGIPQTHVIEGYCSGHRDFVTRLCIVPWKPELLLSGSGEPSLRVYDWQRGLLLDEELFHGGILDELTTLLQQSEDARTVNQVSVSGIWTIHYNATPKSPASSAPPHMILVTLEGMPVVLSYTLSTQGKLQHHQTLTVAGNALDIGIGPALWDIVVSIDNVHRPSSIRSIRPEEVPATEVFESFSLFSDLSPQNGDVSTNTQTGATELRWERTSLAMLLNEAASATERQKIPAEVPSKNRTIYSGLGETLYGRENLRKKRDQAAAEEEDGGEEETPNLEEIET